MCSSLTIILLRLQLMKLLFLFGVIPELEFFLIFTCLEHLLSNLIKSQNSLIYLDAHTSLTL